MRITERDLLLAWMAGLVDGEGYISLNFGSDGITNLCPLVQVAMTDQEVIERLHQITGVGSVTKRNSTDPRHAHCWEWRVLGEKAAQVAREIKPYLFLKDQQADLVIKFQEEATCGTNNRLTLDQIYLRHFLLQEIRKLNKKGRKPE